MTSRSKKTSYEPTIKGRPVSQTDFRNEIARIVKERGRMKPVEVAELLGPEWMRDNDTKHHVSVTMGNMANQGWLVRVQHGIYEIHPHYDQRKARRLEDQIIDTIITLGGVARARDILEDFDARPAANKQRPYGGRGGAAGRIFKLMKESSRIVHYNLPKRPRWGLPWQEMAAQPLTGSIAAYLIEMGFLAAIERGDLEGGPRWHSALQDEIKEHYNVVGMAFRRARSLFDVEPETVAQHPAIAECLEHMKQAAPPMTTRIHADIKNDTLRRAERDGRGNDTNYIERLRDEETEKFHAHVLAYFEMGDPAAHQVAPPRFYRVYAEQFNVDAAALSRGSVIPMSKESDLTEEWWGGEGAIAEFGEPIVQAPHAGRHA